MDSTSVVAYLNEHPEFFEDHPELLSVLRLVSPVGGRAVSLQDRQMEVLREKIKSLDLRLAGLLRVAQDNDAIGRKFELWNRSLLMTRNDVDLPFTLISGLQDIFSVPQVTLRLWNVAPDCEHAWFAHPVSEDSRIFASGLRAPFCGMNNDFEAVSWLDEPTLIQSIALLPLRIEGATQAFGLMVLGSPDPERFASDMSTDFLTKIGATASAALTCMLD